MTHSETNVQKLLNCQRYATTEIGFKRMNPVGTREEYISSNLMNWHCTITDKELNQEDNIT